MSRIRTSPVWTTPTEAFRSVIKQARSLTDVMRHFGFTINGRSSRMIQKRCSEEKIDLSHISLGLASNKNRIFDRTLVPLSTVMIEHSTYSRTSLKKRLLKDKILENKCSCCGIGPVWNSQPLVLRLDHINGVPDDHRKENLRLLCPNCDSQMPTYSGRNNRRKYNCKACGSVISRYSKQRLCVRCNGKTQRKVTRPSRSILLIDIDELGYCGTGRKYGVSDNAIRKWLRTDD